MVDKQDDLEWCYGMLSKVSRTFEIPIKEMSDEKGDYTCIGYLLCRTADTIEDTPHLSGNKKTEILAQYEKLIADPSKERIDEFEETVKSARPDDPLTPAYWDLAENTNRVFNVYYTFPDNIQEGISENVEELVFGMRKFMIEYDGFVRIEDIDEMEEYCFYVAGKVGHMLAEINSDDPSKELRKLAENYGLLLQTVNVSKDVYGDYHEEDNVYIPRELLEKQGVEQDDLLKEENLEGTKKAVDEVIEYSKSKIPTAREYLQEVSKEAGSDHMYSWAIPYLLAIATLRELEENAEQSLTEGGVKMSRNEVANIISESKGIKPDELEQFEEDIYAGKFK